MSEQKNGSIARNRFPTAKEWPKGRAPGGSMAERPISRIAVAVLFWRIVPNSQSLLQFGHVVLLFLESV